MRLINKIRGKGKAEEKRTNKRKKRRVEEEKNRIKHTTNSITISNKQIKISSIYQIYHHTLLQTEIGRVP